MDSVAPPRSPMAAESRPQEGNQFGGAASSIYKMYYPDSEATEGYASSEGGFVSEDSASDNETVDSSNESATLANEAKDNVEKDETAKMDGLTTDAGEGMAVVDTAYPILGVAERLRCKSRESGGFEAVRHPTEDEDAADDFRLAGFQGGTRVYKLAESPVMAQCRASIVKTAVGFSYVDLRDPLVTRGGEDGEEIVNGMFAIRPSPLGGLGAFAVRDITRMEHLLVERPLVRTTLRHLPRALARLTDEQRAVFFGLTGHHPDPTAGEAEKIWTANTFVAGTSHEAVFALGSRFNHACGTSSFRNVDYHFDKKNGVMVFTAVRRITAGDELFISYGKMPKMLFERFGFRCTCGGCAGYPEVEEEEEVLDPW